MFFLPSQNSLLLYVGLSYQQQIPTMFWFGLLKTFEFAQINHTRATNKNFENYFRPTDWTMYTELNYLRCINGELGPENHIKAFHNSRHALYVRRNEMVYMT